MSSQARYGQPGNYNATPASRSDGDPSGFEFDSKGNLLVNLNTPFSLILSGAENDTVGVSPFRRSDAVQGSINFAANTAQSLLAGVTAKSIYVTDVHISSDGGAACSVLLRSTAGSPVILVNKIYFPNTTATSFAIHFAVPKKVAVADGIDALCSSATPNITVDVTGYQL